MAKYAMCGGITPEMTLDDETNIQLDVVYFNTDGPSVVMHNASCQASFGPNAPAEIIHGAMVDSIVAYALATYGWTLPRTKVIHIVIARGLVI